ncbi:MAG: ABC transporter ATP-binding protein/permease [Clostridia bacterium]|nr:ABC transporter ATP-binding protein/permease [Clostridia bacterium]
MLVLRNIVKEYGSGDSRVRALSGVSIDFRKNEFVSILGPSGCGKTTLLNIIGGLDQYTSGDLVINGVSTKKYKDSDWDTYRNHSIGFVFQSYNLIPHQTVLANVELALTLSGISRKERRARAIDALRQVGLGSQLRKKPNQMSGGQMQRVAIARALVNDPDILLADEPTGALDTQTSLQIMEILRRISRRKLIIMVTHNPELAQRYSTRIIRVQDGRIINDSNPYRTTAADLPQAPLKASEKRQRKIGNPFVISEKDMQRAQIGAKPRRRAQKPTRKRSMSFFTALSLSLNNLMTKKARTFMTSFAGSIGIIGIALILSVSSGVTNYINAVQRDTLSTYPLTIMKETQDFSAMFAAMTEVSEMQEGEIDPNKIYVDDSLGSMMSAMSATTSNDLVKFKKYLEENYEKIESSVSDIQYTYDFDLQIFTADGKTQVSPTTIFDNMGDAFAGISEMISMSGTSGFNVMSEMINNQELLDEQYELVGDGSHWPENANEVVLVVNKNNQISKMALYMLGVLDQSELEEIMNKLMTEGEYESSHMEPYDMKDFIGREFLLLNTSDFFAKKSNATYTVDGVEYPVWYDMRTGAFDQESFVTENGTKLVISGIVRPRDGASATSISGAIGYTKGLTDLILEKNTESEVLKQQKKTPDYNVLSGLKFERVPYTRENIHELIEKVDDATMEQLYAYMTQQILKNEEFAGQLVVNSPESFFGFFSIMPAEFRTELFETMLGVIKQKDPSGASLMPLMAALSQGMKNVTVTADNFVTLLPIMPNELQLMALAGLTPSEEMPLPMAIPGFVTLCGEESMQLIYNGMTERIKTLTITEESFTLLLQGNFIPDDQFVEMEEMLYKLAPQTDATYSSTLKTLGDAEAASPASINFYAKDFESKDVIEDFITEYNNGVEEADKLKYTDMVGIMMSSVTTIVNAISYVLIAFVAISLVVSSIMIGIITYISVLERTKEIGILRAIGASKKDIGRVFNAETLIVGFVAGMIGILATLGLNIVINIILFHFTGIASLKAVLPVGGAIALVLISMFLTFIAGLFPSGFAAKRNPVEALRSE